MPDPISGIAAAVSVGGSLLQGDAQASAASDAAAASERASNEAARLQRESAKEAMQISERRYNEGMSYMSPYLSAGSTGLNSFQALGGFYNPATGSVPMTYQEYTASYQKPQPALVAPTPPPVPPSQQSLNINNPFNATPYNSVMDIMRDNSLTQKQKNILKGNASVANGFINQSAELRAAGNDPQKRAQVLLGMRPQDNTANQQYQQQLDAYNQQLAAYNQQQQQLSQQPAVPQQPMMTREEFLARQQQDAYDAQQREIANIERSPLYRSLFQQGEDAILQNASATGGLRGGYAQDKLAYYRPSMLKALIDQKTAQAQWMAGQGQNAAINALGAGQNFAAAQSNILTNSANNQGTLLTNNATNQGNAALAKGQAQSDMFGGIAQGLGGLTSGLNSLFSGGGSGLNIGASQRNVSSYNPGSTINASLLAGFN